MTESQFVPNTDPDEIVSAETRVCEFVVICCSLGLLLISCIDLGVLGKITILIWLGSLVLVSRVNLGAAFGIYVASVAIYAVRLFEGWGSIFQRPDNFALLIILFSLVMAGFRKPLPAQERLLAASILLFVAYILIQMVGFGFLTRSLFAFCMRMFGLPFTFFLLLWRAKPSHRELRGFSLVLMIFGSYIALVSILEVCGWHSILVPRWIGNPALNPALATGRAGGPFLQSEWNGFALSLLFCFPFVGIHKAIGILKVVRCLTLGLYATAIYLTYTRAAWIATTTATLIFFWQVPRPGTFQGFKRAAGAFVVALLVALALMSGGTARTRVQDSGTIYYRFNLWAAGLEMASSRPLFGYGFGQFQHRVSEFKTDWATPDEIPITGEGNVAHNTLVNILVEQGIFGLALYMFIGWQIFSRALRAGATIWPVYGPGWVVAFCLAYFVNSLFVVAYEPTTNYIFYGMLGLLVGLRSRSELVLRFSQVKANPQLTSEWQYSPSAR